jgi:hypothetical protein
MNYRLSRWMGYAQGWRSAFAGPTGRVVRHNVFGCLECVSRFCCATVLNMRTLSTQSRCPSLPEWLRTLRFPDVLWASRCDLPGSLRFVGIFSQSPRGFAGLTVTRGERPQAC